MANLPSTTLCFIDFNNGIIDVTGNSTIENNNVTQSTSQIKFSSQSGYFNKSSNNYIHLTLPSAAKTISMWIYAVGSNTSGWYPTVFSSSSLAASGGTYMHIDDGSYSTYPVFRANAATGTASNNGSYGSTVISRENWHHIALCVDGSSHYFFLDGILQKTITQSNPNDYTEWYIGCLKNSSSLDSGCYFNGYISEILITSDCMYTSDFNVPTEAYTYDASNVPLTVNVSASYGTYSGSISNIIDGSTTTYWWSNNAQSSGQYILFTFNKYVVFNGMTVQTLNNTGDSVSSGSILQVSSNGTEWTTVGNFNGSSESSFSDLNQSNVKYVRIYANTSVNQWLCINEVTLDYSLPVPIITIGVPSQNKISANNGFDECICTFTSDLDLAEWEARATKTGESTGHGVGLLVESGNELSAGVEGVISILDDELTNGDGDYIIFVYGKSTDGVWSDE